MARAKSRSVTDPRHCKGSPGYEDVTGAEAPCEAAKLNCGRCEGCKGRNKECHEFTLHKLRRTFITAMLRSGFDLRTVQSWAGHRDIQSTMRYLRPASAREIQDKLKRKIEW